MRKTWGYLVDLVRVVCAKTQKLSKGYRAALNTMLKTTPSFARLNQYCIQPLSTSEFRFSPVLQATFPHNPQHLQIATTNYLKKI